MCFILVLLALALFSYCFLVKPQLYWKSRNVKQGQPVPLLGDNFKMMFKQEARIEMVRNIYNRFKDARYCGLYQFTMPTLMLRDPNLIKQITTKDFDHFVDHYNFTTDETDPLWSRNLFALTGDNWREMRATLGPTFTASKMRSMFGLMEKSAQQYVDFYLKQNMNVIDLELKDSLTRFATDVIANCAFGIEVDSLKDPLNEFYKNGKEITNYSGSWRSIRFILFVIAPKIIKLFKITKFASHNKAFFTSMVRDAIKVRKEQNIVRPDMIHLLMEVRKGRLRYDDSTEQKDAGFATVEESHVGKTEQVRKTEMTEIDMVAQVMIFFFAGFDTISTMMSFMCYELALNPDIQERLRQEIDKTYEENNGKLSYDIINKMKYMDMVISENMRKNTAIIVIDRVCTKPYTIQPERPYESPVHLQPGDVIWLPIAGLHHDEEFYPNPDKFDPERFSEENKGNIKPYSYIPFGSGPRNCIASRFALMEAKILIFHMLTKFVLTVTEKTTIPMKYAKSRNPSIEGGCWIGFKQRKTPLAQ